MPVTGSPKTVTSPSLAGSRPEMRARVVDLPQPVGPTTAQHSPGWMAMSRSRRAVEYEQRSLAIAQSVASDVAIQAALLSGDPSGLIQPAAERVRQSTGATYVVVTDRQGIRFSHPNPAMIGKPVDEDPSSVLAGNTWVGIQT